MKKILFLAALFTATVMNLNAETVTTINPHEPYLEDFESYGPTCTYTLTTTKGYEISPSWWEKAIIPKNWTVGNELIGTDTAACTSTTRSYLPFIFSNGSVTVNTTTKVVTTTNYYNKGTALTTGKYAPAGCNALKMCTSTSYGIVWAAMPELTVEDISSLEITGLAKFNAPTATIPHSLIVGIMEDPTDLSTFVVLDSITTGAGIAYSSTAQKFEVSVIKKGYTGKGRYLAFRTAYNPNASATAKYKVCGTTVYLDNVALSVDPFYAFNNWDTESDWSWKQMVRISENICKMDNVVYGGSGINFNDTTDNQGAIWVAESDFKGDKVRAKDTVSFTYNISTHEVTMTLVGHPTEKITMAAEYGTHISANTCALAEGLKAYSCAEVNAQGILQLVADTIIRENTPYILKGTAGTTYPCVITSTGTYTEPVKVGLLTGVYADTTAPVESYVLQNPAAGLGFYVVAAGQQPTVPANHCYLTLSKPSVKALYFDEETAIADVDADVDADHNGKFFENGKIVIVKNNAKYNVAGQLIK